MYEFLSRCRKTCDIFSVPVVTLRRIKKKKVRTVISFQLQKQNRSQKL